MHQRYHRYVPWHDYLPGNGNNNDDNDDDDDELEFTSTNRKTSSIKATTASSASQSKILESRDVANTYSIPDDFISFPLGHNTMVAVAQSRFTFVFKGGRPLMDKLADEMIDEILNFNVPPV